MRFGQPGEALAFYVKRLVVRNHTPVRGNGVTSGLAPFARYTRLILPKEMVMARMPDFVIIGAMKCATSTLHEQLAQQPGICMTEPKEPNFFSDADQYARHIVVHRSFCHCEQRRLVRRIQHALHQDPHLSAYLAAHVASMFRKHG